MKPATQRVPRFAIRAIVLCLSSLALLASDRPATASSLFDAAFGVFPTGANPTSVTLGDFDEDGVTDAAATTNPSSVSVHRGDGAGAFLPPSTFATAINPNDLASGDLNEDGHLDLAVTSGNTHVVSILLGDGHGLFSTSIPYPAGPGAGGIALGDLNGDGHLDAVVTNEFVDSVSVLLGVGDGTLLPPIDTGTAFNPGDVAIGDWSGDQIPDIAIANSSYIAGGVSLLRGRGDGTFEDRIDLACDAGAYEVHLRDLNGDGRLDIATAVSGASPLSVFLAQAGGGFGSRTDYGSGSSQSMAMGDWNSDGHLDAAVGLNEPDRALAILLGDGTGGFGTPRSVPAGGSPFGLAAGLITDDSILDLVAVQIFSSTLEVHAGNGDGTFGQDATYPALYRVRSISVADFDRDGTLDVAAATDAESSTGEKHVSIFTGNPNGTLGPRRDYPAGNGYPELDTGDVDADGITDLVVIDILETSSGSVALLRGLPDGSFATAQEFPCGPNSVGIEMGDFNGDGRSDVAVANNSFPSSVSILLAAPGGGFAAPVAYPIGYSPYSLTSDDFDGDGDLDLAVVRSGFVSVFLGAGDGTFGAAVDYGAGGNATEIASGDIDQNGSVDLVVGNLGYGLIVFRGAGDGTFLDTFSIPFQAYVRSIVIGDVDGDGRRDLITACDNYGTVFVLFGDDGTFSRQTHIGVGLSPLDVAAGDWNHDGRLDLVAGLNAGAAIVSLVQKGAGGPASLEAHVTLTPPVLNVRSRAPWLTAYVELPVGYDPASIDVATVRLGGTAIPVSKPNEIGDANQNGIPDLMLKFERSAFPGLQAGHHELVLSGYLTTGESFEGTGVIEVISRGQLDLRPASGLGALPVTLRIGDPEPVPHTVRVYDTHGRLVRRWTVPGEEGALVRWNGRASSGQNAPAGIYWISVEAGGRQGTRKVTLLR